MDPLEVVESTADAAFATDEEGRIVIWNRAAERLLGHVAARALGKPCHEVLCGADVFGARGTASTRTTSIPSPGTRFLRTLVEEEQDE